METGLNYERRVSSSKLKPYAEMLTTWLGIDATNSQKQRRNLRRIHTYLASPSITCRRDRARNGASRLSLPLATRIAR